MSAVRLAVACSPCDALQEDQYHTFFLCFAELGVPAIVPGSECDVGVAAGRPSSVGSQTAV